MNELSDDVEQGGEINLSLSTPPSAFSTATIEELCSEQVALENEALFFNAVFVGGGVHSSLLATHYGRRNPSACAILIEETSTTGTQEGRVYLTKRNLPL